MPGHDCVLFTDDIFTDFYFPVRSKICMLALKEVLQTHERKQKPYDPAAGRNRVEKIPDDRPAAGGHNYQRKKKIQN